MININKYSMGATAAIITSMGLIAGLTQGADQKIEIITGLLIIAIADNISDSFSIHIYKESEGASHDDVRAATFGNFTIRFLLALTFVAVIFFFSPYTALIISSIWGLTLLAILSYLIARDREVHPFSMVVRHLITAILVIVGSKVLGNLILQTKDLI